MKKIGIPARPDDPSRYALSQIPRFIEKAKRAGVTRVFIGLENINPGNLLAVKKRQNKDTRYRQDAACLESALRHHARTSAITAGSR